MKTEAAKLVSRRDVSAGAALRFVVFGSAAIGILYDISIAWLVIFSVAAQLASIPVFLAVRREMASPQVRS